MTLANQSKVESYDPMAQFVLGVLSTIDKAESRKHAQFLIRKTAVGSAKTVTGGGMSTGQVSTIPSK